MSSGCTTQYFSLLERYRNAPICCEAISEFAFESIQIGDKLGFHLNEKSPAYMFKTGKSYFKAFELPQSSYPYQVSVGSCILGGFDPDYALFPYVFFPQLLTLNEKYEVVRSSYPVDFRAREVLLTEIDHIESILEPYCSGHIVEGKIFFLEENKTEKYLIIMTTNELRKAKTSYFTWEMEMSQKIGDYWVPGRSYKVKEVAIHSPVGLIMLSVQAGLF
jgi:maltose operon protein